MKLLVILISHEFTCDYCGNIKILNDYLAGIKDVTVHYGGVSSTDDFHNVENLISFKYKMVNPKLQMSKMFHFINEYKSEFDYDWYIKIRPDVKLLEPFNFEILSDTAINARARNYTGPKKIKYGLSVNGEGSAWGHIDCCFCNDKEVYLELDDIFYIFHQNVINIGAFDNDSYIDSLERHNEGTQKYIFDSRGIPQNVIGLHIEFTKYNVFSGHVNM
jgi:hypothetical protein